ncbi:MAG: hypothetical protein HYR55_12890 [Acidobacteria bacterium]|nr:hypothetical protein [Acidobacteriota bacterium]MBI3655023.1 hypothetical protein [Acidobacteriota bacterium]
MRRRTVHGADKDLSRPRWNYISLLALFILVSLSRVLYTERSFWEWDEVLFAGALRRFDVLDNYPHLPGYPLYVAFSRVSNYFFHNDVSALTSVNAGFGSLLLFPLYFFYRRFSSFPIAFAACFLALFNWLIWIYSESAFSDMTSLFWLITSLAFLFRTEHDPSFYLGMLCFGVSTGVSPQKAIFGSLLVPWLVWRRVRRREFKSTILGVGLLAGMCLVWFVPLVRNAGGFWVYMGLMHYGPENFLGYITARPFMSLSDFTRTKIVLMWGHPFYAVIVVSLAIWGFLVYTRRGPGKTLPLLFMAFGPWIVIDFLWLHLYHPRYNFYTVVLMAFFVMYGLLERLSRSSAWANGSAAAAAIGMILFSIFWTLPCVRTLHTTDSTVTQMFALIRKNLNPKTDAVIPSAMLALLPRYYLPDFISIPGEGVDENMYVDAVRNMEWHYISLYDPTGAYQATFHAGQPRLRALTMYPDLALAKKQILYGAVYDTEWVLDRPVRKAVASTANCYLKNRGRAKLLSLESTVLPFDGPPAEIRLALDGMPLATSVAGPGRFDRHFLFKETPDPSRPASIFSITSTTPRSAAWLKIDALRWWDIEATAETEIQTIDVSASSPWVSWSRLTDFGINRPPAELSPDSLFSVWKIPLQPRGIYEVSFRASASGASTAGAARPSVAVCLGNRCTPHFELYGAQQTHNNVFLSPTLRAGEKAALIFHYRHGDRVAPSTDSPETTPAHVAISSVTVSLLGFHPDGLVSSFEDE